MDRTTLIKQCQNGDRESLGELYRLYSRNALGTAYLISGSKGIAEDIMQEAFIHCFKNIKKLSQPGAFDVWFYKILVRTGWKMVCRHNNSVTAGDMASYADYPGCGTCGLETSDTSLDVYDALEKLNIPLRTVVVLHYFNDMSIKEISGVLGCFQGTVKSRLHNARKLLKKLLSEEDDVIQTISVVKECGMNGNHTGI